ncbi:pilus assembly protein PilP [Thermodesulfovibrio sp. 1176]|uniref:pilus assembly protein PilP n=1 Tax=Thermodesulfovibrio sp. 1176 TaxID=3043424 RepID=UPI002482C75E|nr:pilus assembly protein PilP [Thermodesulfovibrio sp. 1176]MDI1471124.1 pilus assembly protein PilP [Thermodesulfovibrio sp. 1176]
MKNKKIIYIVTIAFILIITGYFIYNLVLMKDKPKETPLPQPVKKEITQKVETPPNPSISFIYDSENLRDPFAPLIVKRQINQKTGSPLERYDIEELKVTGIVFDKKGAMALIQTPDGKFYVARQNDKIGMAGGTIFKIHKDFIEIKEPPAFGSTVWRTKHLKLRLEEEQ